MRRLIFNQQVSIFLGGRLLDIIGIFRSECNCLLKAISWIGSIPNFSNISVLLIGNSCTSHIIIPSIFLIQVVDLAKSEVY